MKKISILLAMILCVGLLGCQKEEKKDNVSQMESVKIELSNSEILVDGEKISEEEDAAVYKAHDIIFYLEGQGIEYGDGEKKDEHSKIEADAHTVVHITEPGTYEFSGTLDAGQIFVDLGEDTKKDEEAIVNIVLNNVDLTCTVAPAIFFYRTYECDCEAEEENAAMNVDTSAAGANLILAEGSKNKVYGSYVAEIFEECELNEKGTKVVNSKRLHKYDGAIYSRRSMNISGTGALSLVAENEGLGSEMHLTINGGDISITSGNDGINVNEDNISVFTMNAGELKIKVTGETGEGDGIDANGWLVVNGGTINSAACATSMDSGIDADKGIYINGGTLVATGNMAAELEEGAQTVISFMSREVLEAGKNYEVKDADGEVVEKITLNNDCTTVVVSIEGMTKEQTYTLWKNDTQVAEGTAGAMAGRPPQGFGGGKRPQMPEGMQPPEGFEDMEPPEGFEGMEPPADFDGKQPPRGPGKQQR